MIIEKNIVKQSMHILLKELKFYLLAIARYLLSLYENTVKPEAPLVDKD